MGYLDMGAKIYVRSSFLEMMHLGLLRFIVAAFQSSWQYCNYEIIDCWGAHGQKDFFLRYSQFKANPLSSLHLETIILFIFVLHLIESVTYSP